MITISLWLLVLLAVFAVIGVLLLILLFVLFFLGVRENYGVDEYEFIDGNGKPYTPKHAKGITPPKAADVEADENPEHIPTQK